MTISRKENAFTALTTIFLLAILGFSWQRAMQAQASNHQQIRECSQDHGGVLDVEIYSLCEEEVEQGQ